MKKMGLIVALPILIGSTLGAAERDTFGKVMAHYEPIRLALLGDSMDGVNSNGTLIATELRALAADFSADRAGASADVAAVVRDQLDEMIAAADAIASASTLEAARDGLYALSKPLVRWREGVTQDSPPNVAYCPMHRRSWLQLGEQIGNPYGGMPGCGSIVSK